MSEENFWPGTGCVIVAAGLAIAGLVAAIAGLMWLFHKIMIAGGGP